MLLNKVIHTYSSGFWLHSCGIDLHSGGFRSHSSGFQWIPADSGHSCRNGRGSDKYCNIPWSLFFTICFCHYHPSLLQISSTPIKFWASFSVMWLDDHHLISLRSCVEQLLYCSSDLMFLVILYSWVQYPFISVFLYTRNSCASARLQFVIN